MLVKRRYRDLDTFFDATGRTQQWLADQLGVDRSYISLIAGGKRQPSLRLSLRIEALTGVAIKSLVTDETEPEQASA